VIGNVRDQAGAREMVAETVGRHEVLDDAARPRGGLVQPIDRLAPKTSDWAGRPRSARVADVVVDWPASGSSTPRAAARRWWRQEGERVGHADIRDAW
jgi:hypothetical protein